MDSSRAGRYIRQPQGFRAFIPNSLPPDPPVEMTNEMWTALSQADRAIARLDGATSTLPNPDLFVFMYIRREAVLSSQIEGTQASLIDLLEFETQAPTSPAAPTDVAEVANYVAAMNHGLSRLDELPLSLRLVREIHARLMEGTRGAERSPGEFRTSQNWIGAAGASLSEALYVPPPPHEMLTALDAFEKFLHDATPMPDLIRVGLAHAQFETIHPFLDGNGRVGRLLIAFFLYERKVLARPLLYISHYFRQNRDEYYSRLQAVRDRGDWEGWLLFFLRGVAAVAEEATTTARRILELREALREVLTKHFGTAARSSLVVAEALFQYPIVSVRQIAALTGLSFSNANNLVRAFVEMGVLEERTGRKRDRRFAFKDYLSLFDDAERPATERGSRARPTADARIGPRRR
jgi:Fic family protein